MNRPLVSVIVVCHNDGPNLEMALDSALQQTYQSLEVIVVDNASTDDTPELIAGRYRDRVRYIRQGNLGAGGGRNTGLLAANGEYIQLLDGDDLLAPNKIEKQVAFLERNPEVAIAYGCYRTFRGTPDVPAEVLFDLDPLPTSDMRALLIDRCPAPPIAFLFRRAVVERIGLQEPNLYAEDYEYWLRAAFAGFGFAPTPDAWCFYRRRMGQKSQERWHMARANIAVYQRARHYITDEPYRSMLMEKLAKLEHAFGHFYFWNGDVRRARKLLRHSAKITPANSSFRPPAWTEWLTAVPGGATLYGCLRRLRGLRPPFAIDPDASRREAAALAA